MAMKKYGLPTLWLLTLVLVLLNIDYYWRMQGSILWEAFYMLLGR